MLYSVDVKDEYSKCKSKFLRCSLLFSFLLTVVLVTDTLLVILTKENYTFALVIAIVITVLFSWYAIFFFSNIYNEVNTSYRYYKGYESGLKSIEEAKFISIEDNLEYVNGLYVYPVHITSFDGLVSQDKVIYSLEKNLTYQKGDKLTITTYQRILMKAELHA